MRRPFIFAIVAVTALFAAALTWVVLNAPWAAGDESLATKVERVMQEEAAKERFTGQLGDFKILVPENSGEAAQLIACPDGQPASQVSREEARQSELWSDAFEVPEGAAWACSDVGVRFVNNSGLEGSTTTGEDVAIIRMYFPTLPVPVVRNAPRDRLELIDVTGKPGLLETPIEGYPYGLANLAVIEREPADGAPGIILRIERASSAQRAIEIASQVIR
jgi:hypothetical protein